MMKPAKAALASQMETAVALQDVPLTVFMEFYFRRPKVHFKKGKLREDAPKFVTKTPRCSTAPRGRERQGCHEDRGGEEVVPDGHGGDDPD